MFTIAIVGGLAEAWFDRKAFLLQCISMRRMVIGETLGGSGLGIRPVDRAQGLQGYLAHKKTPDRRRTP